MSWKKIVAGLAVLLLALVAVLVVRAMVFTPEHAEQVSKADITIDGQAIAAHLSQAVQFKTISYQPPKPIDRTQFQGFLAWLQETYPHAHAAMSREMISDLTPLYTWAGSDPSLKPILLTAHYDVVPVIPGTENDWHHPPFAGEIADKYIWGRGTLDDKSAVIAIMEAVEALAAKGYKPKRTILLSFGFDEEIGGFKGAKGVAEHLKNKGIEAAWSLDEGSFVLDGMIPGVTRPVASINLAEKGYLTVQLIATGAGGHSSMPPPETAVGILSEAVVKLQNAPFPGGLDGVTGQMFDAIGRDLPFVQRLLFANRWLFGGVLESVLAGAKTTNAMLRTTTAPTMLRGSVKENVLPIKAVGTVNFRLHPRDSIDDALAYIAKTIDDKRIEIKVLTANPASKVASSTSAGFELLARTSRQIYGNIVIAPGLTIAGTDSVHYQTVADDSYRFNPMVVGPKDIEGFHGTNESISIANMVHATAFYRTIMENGGSQ